VALNLPQCYYDSMMYTIRSNKGEIVHGTVFSGLLNKRIAHAWVEFGDIVWDPQLRKELAKSRYYSLTKTKPIHRYKTETAIINSFRSSIFGGPWKDL